MESQQPHNDNNQPSQPSGQWQQGPGQNTGANQWPQQGQYSSQGQYGQYNQYGQQPPQPAQPQYQPVQYAQPQQPQYPAQPPYPAQQYPQQYQPNPAQQPNPQQPQTQWAQSPQYPQQPQYPQGQQPYQQYQAAQPGQQPYRPQNPNQQTSYPTQAQPGARSTSHKAKHPQRNKTGQAKPKGQKRKPKWWVILIAIVVALALVFGIASVAGYYMLKADGAIDGIMADSTMPNKEQAYAGMPSDKYQFKDPIAVDTYYEFELIMKDPVKIKDSVKWGEAQMTGVDLSLDDCVRVYQDSSFGVPVPTSTIATEPFNDKEGTGTITVSGNMDLPKDMQHGDSIGKERGFLPSDGYYYVQYVGANGKKLSKPIVQFFRVKEHTDITRLPQVNNVTPVVNKDGGVDISWDKVDGAKSYNVYAYIRFQARGNEGDENYSPEHFSLEKIGSSSKTQLLSADYDKPKEYKDDTLGTSVLKQNMAFQSLAVESQDYLNRCEKDTSEYCAEALQEAGGGWDAESAGKLYFVVTAVDKDGHEGRWHAIDANNLVPTIPIGQATQAQTDQWSYGLKGVFGEDNTVEEDMQAYVYTFVEMANGATVAVPSEFSDLTSNGRNGWKFIYSAPGTKIKNTGNLYYEGDLTQTFSQITKAATDALPKAGGVLDRLNSVGKTDWTGYDKKKIDSDTKESPFFSYASTDFGKYLANNILNGHEVIDITKYASDEYQTSTQDVMSEVIYQNPYIAVDSTRVSYTVRKNGDKTVMWVKYPENYQQRQKEVESLVNSVKGQFQGSDSDKAVAIDQYLAGKMEYDYDSISTLGDKNTSKSTFDNSNTDVLEKYPNAWSVYGMVSGKGVCMSYAYAYQVLAKAAGLDSRVVVGSVSGAKISHAWNYVHINGEWLLIDSTWDDTGSTAYDKYQLKKPSDVTDHFAFEQGWTLASEAGNYK
ncbi:transglutaminase [Bifidobacterium saguini DSM 23967]|uniref:Transglutaminase n=2 Tax=Bifidobacterium saguini TaxID=762210 RepID=A0A087DES6_9BIFI|nr:transglutaminase domain-containing protein [Bifidobacterium saguini]KFI94026.1 transglutaminase [Bifidobacterium saguini DSM 23967]QTB90339.1 transglutaminase domain-containing protein [Bifidobacterium saguini]